MRIDLLAGLPFVGWRRLAVGKRSGNLLIALGICLHWLSAIEGQASLPRGPCSRNRA